MKHPKWGLSALPFIAILVAASCGSRTADPAAEAPPPAQVMHEPDGNVVEVEHPEQFPLATATARKARPELRVTGVVQPDISRNVPVISLASGKVVDIRARLGDTVKKGQILMRLESADISGAFSDYRRAVADETLARSQLDRSNDLYAHGAIAMNDLQVAQDAEDKAKVDLETTEEHLRLLGSDPSHPSGIVNLVAPISGVITDQQITNAGGVQALGANPFTISDLADVWILCDVYENDLPDVRVGDAADIRLNAYPDRVFKGRVGNIGEILDPSIRTAKVRVEVRNPGLMRVGMFVTATFHGAKEEMHAVIPADAILHLQDRDWVYVPAGNRQFRRVEITGGDMLPGKMQEVISGIKPGDQVVSNALVLENTAEP